MSYVKPVSMDETLNFMYKTLKPGTETKLENFNGKRKISVYRGENYMNKVTRKLDTPERMFIRAMRNIGTKEEPKMATNAIVFKAPKLEARVYFNEFGNSAKGIVLNLYRRGFEPLREAYNSMAELRADKRFIQILDRTLGTNFDREGLKFKKIYADEMEPDYSVLLKKKK